mmetsp:Transcript_13161/g.18870  ORF Transcript_13161/g.18870 Transcript_13161/m.18870 type:complete len:603 (+) Transcript_13161:53-1861(+)
MNASGGGTWNKTTGSNLAMNNCEKELQDIESLRQHILSCREVSSSSRATKCVLMALDFERQKIVRDEKLKRKFSKETTPVSTTSSSSIVVAPHIQQPQVLVDDPTIRASVELLEEEVYPRRPTTTTTATTTVEDDDEWQDIHPREENEEEASEMGTLLAQMSIASLAEFDVRVSDPVSLIAVAIHSLLRSDMLSFQCTGIPLDSTAVVFGFAAPIRELPKTVYLPKDWDRNSISTTNISSDTITHLGTVVLRYRKLNVEKPMILRVSLLPTFFSSEDDEDFVAEDPVVTSLAPYCSTTTTRTNTNPTTCFMWDRMPWEQLEKLTVQVDFGPSSSSFMDISSTMTFPLGRHVNILSLMAAISSVKQSGPSSTSTSKPVSVPPALHYKSLSNLLLAFIRTFDLGHIFYDSTCTETAEEATIRKQHASSFSYNNTVAQQQQEFNYYKDKGETKRYTPSATPTSPAEVVNDRNIYTGEGTRPTIDSAFFGGRHFQDGGDFAGDLLTPVGNFGGSSSRAPPPPAGNLMGPNHPMFTTDGRFLSEPDAVIGGLGMRPRFDPYGPPGGPTDPLFVNPGRRGRGRGGTGDPNPDHLRPPQGFGQDDNMFS